jgi:hypothetical protein
LCAALLLLSVPRALLQAARDNEQLRAKLLEQKRRKAAAASHHGEEDRECEALSCRLDAEKVT